MLIEQAECYDEMVEAKKDNLEGGRYLIVSPKSPDFVRGGCECDFGRRGSIGTSEASTGASSDNKNLRNWWIQGRPFHLSMGLRKGVPLLLVFLLSSNKMSKQSSYDLRWWGRNASCRDK